MKSSLLKTNTTTRLLINSISTMSGRSTLTVDTTPRLTHRPVATGRTKFHPVGEVYIGGRVYIVDHTTGVAKPVAPHMPAGMFSPREKTMALNSARKQSEAFDLELTSMQTDGDATQRSAENAMTTSLFSPHSGDATPRTPAEAFVAYPTPLGTAVREHGEEKSATSAYAPAVRTGSGDTPSGDLFS